MQRTIYQCDKCGKNYTSFTSVNIIKFQKPLDGKTNVISEMMLCRNCYKEVFEWCVKPTEVVIDDAGVFLRDPFPLSQPQLPPPIQQTTPYVHNVFHNGNSIKEMPTNND